MRSVANINAALGVAQLEKLPDRLERKRTLAKHYIDAFNDIDGAQIVSESDGCRSNYWLVTLLLTSQYEYLRDTILESLNRSGLGLRPAWTPMHRLPMFGDTPKMDLSTAESLAARLINLPSSPALAESEIAD